MHSVLIVDDEKMIADALSRILSRDGFNVVAVNSGMHALTALKENSFDAAILDLLMSEINGEEILDWITHNSPQTKVIMMTAYGDAKVKQQLLEKGALEVVAKPFDDIFQFTQLLKNFLN